MKPILPLDEFLKLEADEQVENLKRWKSDYTLKDIREAWGFKHSAQYYMLLKKLRIYERVVNKSDKFYPDQLSNAGAYQLDRSGEALASFGQSARKLSSDHFGYQLNVSMTGPELAEKLERLAQFLKGEQKLVAVKLSVEAIAEEDSKENTEEA